MPDAAVRIERLSKRGLFWSGVAFAAAYALSFAVVKTAPALLERRSCADESFACTALEVHNEEAWLSLVCDAAADGDCQAVWTGELTDMTAEQQGFGLTAEPQLSSSSSSSSASASFDLPIAARVTLEMLEEDGTSKTTSAEHDYTVSCSNDGCDPFLIVGEHQVQFPAYRVGLVLTIPRESLSAGGFDVTADALPVVFELLSFNPEYTAFEIAFKYCFCALTLVAMFLPRHGLFARLHAVRRQGAAWTYEQKWAAALLLGLLLFDDPCVALAIYDDPHFAWAMLYALEMASFVAALLLFWLCLLDDVLRGARAGGAALAPPRDRGYYAPKLQLVGALWVTLVSAYAYTRLAALSDPTVLGSDDWATPRAAFMYTVLALGAVYALWLLALGLRAWWRGPRLLPPFRFLSTLTLFVVLHALGSMLAGSFLALETAAAFNYLEFYWVCNLYVWMLAYAYAPVTTSGAGAGRYASVEMQALNEEDEEDFI